MRWRQGRRSQNVEDRRGRGGGRLGGGVGRGVGGIGCLGLVAILVFVLLGGDPEQLVDLAESGGSTPGSAGGASAHLPGSSFPPGGARDDAGEFIRVVLGSTEDAWAPLFASAGSRYPQPTLVLFDRAVQSACGYNTAATGPFYCPGDRQLYFDTSFFDELARLGGPGDFAQAYVIGHEVGHHIQTVTGLNSEVRQLQRRASEVRSNQFQVLMELQADCYAGIWAHHANRTASVTGVGLEPGDVEEGLAAAAAIGDDRLQRQAGRRVTPDAFTHGTSRQRQEWLVRGLRSGRVEDCDTFAAAGL